MSEKKIIRYSVIFMIIVISAIGYYNWESQKKLYDMHSCSHLLFDASISIHNKVERNLKEIKHLISKSEDLEKLELLGENRELQWQNEKLMKELLNMFNLFRVR